MALLDQFMQNPSTILGLSVLNQADRPAAGLLQGQLLNQRLQGQRSAMETEALRRDLMNQQILKAQQESDAAARRQAARENVFSPTPLTGNTARQMVQGQIPPTTQSLFQRDDQAAIQELLAKGDMQGAQALIQWKNATKETGPGQVFNLGGPEQLDPFRKKLLEQEAIDFADSRDKAKKARESLIRSKQAIQFLNQGMTVGTGAKALNYLGGALQQIGINFAEDARANSQAFAGAMAVETANMIQNFGAGTGLSDADREFSTRAVGGDIEMTPEAIRRLMRINAEVNAEVIRMFNKSAEEISAQGIPEAFKRQLDVPEIPDFSEPQESIEDIKERLRGM